jgi:uncharacterized protein (TIGR03437 family)
VGVTARSLFLSALLCGVAAAAPQLRLSTAAVGPVFITTGQDGPPQAVAATNAGDGSLTLSASANATWIDVSVRGSGTIQIDLKTASLTRGEYTGLVTVSDPNAIDAPQTITVTVQIGSAVPDSVDLYLAPGGAAASEHFTVASRLSTTVMNSSGGPVLSVSTPGGGSFAFTFSYDVTAQAPAGTAENDYQGSFTVNGSSSPDDNKTVPVTMHVTTEPIASAPGAVRFRIAQGAAKQTQAIAVQNLGLGTLTLSGVTGAPAWLTATIQGDYVVLVADPTGMDPGSYSGTLSIASNARNGPSTVSVDLDVLTTGPPVTYYQGVLDNALFAVGDPLAPGGIVALFGEQLTTGDVTKAASLPLDTKLGGATVYVNDQPAPVYYVSAGQIDFLIPYATPPGTATVRVDRDGQQGNSVSVKIVARAPRLLRLGIGDYPIAVFPDNVTFPIPPTPGIPSRPAKAGEDYIVFYALGLGQTNPPAQDGQPAGEAHVDTLELILGQSTLPGTGIAVDPDYAGLTPGSVGLYQVNIKVPANSPKGDAIPVFLDINGVHSNRVNIAIE